MLLGKLVEVKGILPLPPQVFGFEAVPTVRVGVGGSVKVLEVATEPTQLLTVTEKLL